MAYNSPLMVSTGSLNPSFGSITANWVPTSAICNNPNVLVTTAISNGVAAVVAGIAILVAPVLGFILWKATYVRPKPPAKRLLP